MARDAWQSEHLADETVPGGSGNSDRPAARINGQVVLSRKRRKQFAIATAGFDAYFADFNGHVVASGLCIPERKEPQLSGPESLDCYSLLMLILTGGISCPTYILRQASRFSPSITASR